MALHGMSNCLALSRQPHLKSRFAGCRVTMIAMKMRKDRIVDQQIQNVQKNLRIHDYIPKSINQQNYVKALNNEETKIVIVSGPAGTGKTLFSCKTAINLLMAGKLKKIVITRPLVSVDEELGFLPGTIESKMDPWIRPVFDIFLEYFTKKELDTMLSENTIEISPLAYMRGRTFSDTFIIADEMQNSSPSQMQMLTTRIGKNTRLVISGDLKQSDRMTHNGLKDIVDRIKVYNTNHVMNCQNNNNMIALVTFDSSDVQRSKIVKQVLDIYDYHEPSREVRHIKPIDFDALYTRSASHGC